MLPHETRQRQKILTDHIFELSEKVLGDDSEELKIHLNRLSEIYKDDFRHNYSDFFPIILELFKDDNKYSQDFLVDNLEKLHVYLEEDHSKGKKAYSSIYLQFTKLCEHLNLQISQLNYFSITESKLNDSKKDLMQAKEELNITKKEIEQASMDLKEANKKANSLQTEFIAILGIFAGIVLAFNGGLTFSASVLQSMNSASIYRVVIVTVLIGMILINILYCLFYYIAKLINQEKVKKITPIYIANFACIVILGIVLILWYFGFAEKVAKNHENIYSSMKYQNESVDLTYNV